MSKEKPRYIDFGDLIEVEYKKFLENHEDDKESTPVREDAFINGFLIGVTTLLALVKEEITFNKGETNEQ